MEADGQRLYSVLTRTEVREKMMKEVNQISEVFSLSKSDATVVLMRLRWNSFQASDRLGDNKEKFLSELGLVRVFDSKENQSNSCSADHEITHSDADGDYLVSTPFCSHKFSTTCWREYLIESLEKISRNNKSSEEKGVLISCLNQDCFASVGPDTIEQLPEPVKEMYESYVLGSFVERNKDSIKWCPEKGCGHAIEIHEDVDESIDFGVVCLCGYIFCWKCKLESHRPVTCNNASLWLNQLLDQARSLVWISKNTKPCPNCDSPVRKEDDSALRLVTCICSHTFCWICLREEAVHKGKWNCARKAVVLPPMNQEKADFENTQILHLNLWDANHEAIEKAKSELKSIEQNSFAKLTETCGLGYQDIDALKEALMLNVQCKQVLKWSCVFEHFINDYQIVKKQYVNHLRGEAATTLVKHNEIVHELMNEALSAKAFNYFEHKVRTITANTGNYFHEYVKSLEDGLPEVKVENAPVSYWFCDRCTFQNSLFDQECKMCYLPLASPSRMPFGNSNNASAHFHQQVPNMANEEDTKPGKFE